MTLKHAGNAHLLLAGDQHHQPKHNVAAVAEATHNSSTRHNTVRLSTSQERAAGWSTGCNCWFSREGNRWYALRLCACRCRKPLVRKGLSWQGCAAVLVHTWQTGHRPGALPVPCPLHGQHPARHSTTQQQIMSAKPCYRTNHAPCHASKAGRKWVKTVHLPHNVSSWSWCW